MNSLLEVHTFCHAAELGFSKSLQAIQEYEDRQPLYSGFPTPTNTGARRPDSASDKRWGKKARQCKRQTLGQEGPTVQVSNAGARKEGVGVRGIQVEFNTNQKATNSQTLI